MIYWGYILAFSAIIVAALIYIWAKFIWPQLVVDQYATYAIRTESGIKRFPSSRSRLRKNILSTDHEYVVRGEQNAKRFQIDSRDRDEKGEWFEKKIYLMNPRTGELDLRKHTMILQPFEVHSNDHHLMRAYASVEFQLDQDRLFRCFEFGNIGNTLLSRAENNIRAQISGLENQEISPNIESIINNLFDYIQGIEQRDFEKFNEWKSDSENNSDYSIFFKQNRSDALGIHVTNVSVQVEQIDPAPDPETMALGSVMTISPAHLDNVRDMFLQINNRSNNTNVNYLEPSEKDRVNPYTAANQALLQMLEMHTRENIASKMGQSGQMVVISSDDLGLARASVFRSGIKVEQKEQ